MAATDVPDALARRAATAEPGQTLTVLTSERWVRARRAGSPLADSRRALLLLTDGPGRRRPPVYAFPRDDVAVDRLQPADRVECPQAGAARLLDLVGDGDGAGGGLRDAAWSYESPPAHLGSLAGRVLFAWEAADDWLEEDERIHVHPTDPFHRVDALAASRHVRVELDGERLAESDRPTMVFETGRPPRAYLPAADVWTSLLAPSATRTRCPVKGLASWFDVRLDGRRVADAAWSYPFPIPQLPAIAGLVCFDSSRVAVRIEAPRAAVR